MVGASLDYEHGGLYGPGTEPVQGFLAGVRTRDPLNVLDNIILTNEKPGSADRPASSILSSKHQPRDPR